jgi:hypothetical protein
LCLYSAHALQLWASVDTREKLKKVKKDTSAKSIDAVINSLLNPHLDPRDEDVMEDDEQEEDPGSQKRRNVNVRTALFSLEILSERDGMLEYLTGFIRREIDLLIKRFEEVRFASFFF